MKLSAIRNNKILKTIGVILMIASIAYIARTIYKSREILADALNGKCILIMVLLAVLVCGMMFVYGLFYRNLLCSLSGREVSKKKCIGLYVHSTLYKYLPGNVLHFVGRNALAEDGTVGFKDINISSLLEVVVTALSAGIVAVLFAGQYLIDYLSQRINIWWIIALCGLGCVVVVVLLLTVGKKAIQAYVFRKEVFRALTVMLIINTLWNVVGNTLFGIILSILGNKLTMEEYRMVIGGATGAWLAGFLVPGAPGGIGIREAMLNFLLGSFAPVWAVSAAGVMTRISQIAGELLANLVLLVANSFSNAEKQAPKAEERTSEELE